MKKFVIFGLGRTGSSLMLLPPAFAETYVTKPWSRPYSELITHYAELAELARQLETDD